MPCSFLLGEKAATDTAEVYKLFFDVEEETPEKVNDVLENIYGKDSNDGATGEIVGPVFVDNNGRSHCAPFSDWGQ